MGKWSAAQRRKYAATTAKKRAALNGPELKALRQVPSPLAAPMVLPDASVVLAQCSLEQLQTEYIKRLLAQCE